MFYIIFLGRGRAPSPDPTPFVRGPLNFTLAQRSTVAEVITLTLTLGYSGSWLYRTLAIGADTPVSASRTAAGGKMRTPVVQITALFS